jgi:hypothetical protein
MGSITTVAFAGNSAEFPRFGAIPPLSNRVPGRTLLADGNTDQKIGGEGSMRSVKMHVISAMAAFALAAPITLSPIVLSQGAKAQDSVSLIQPDDSSHHEGYYYPKPETVEKYLSNAVTLPESDRVRRQAFVIGMTKQLLGGQYQPSYAIFVKGNESEKLIIVGLIDGQLDTVYRARALLATFTSVARTTPFFQQNVQPDTATFFDFMKLLGFKMVTISDGKKFAHQVIVD